MTEGQTPPEEPGAGEPSFEDPAHDEIRELLRQARADEPVPDDVVARLDATLAGLRRETAAPATVVPLGKRRSRSQRWVAAAVVLAAVGIGGVAVRSAGVSGGGSDDKAAAATRAQDAPAEDAPSVNAPSASGDLDTRAKRQLSTHPVGRFTRDGFAAQAAGFEARDLLLDRLLGRYAAGSESLDGVASSTTDGPLRDYHSDMLDEQSAARAAKAACTRPAVPHTFAYPVDLDGAPAVLVVHKVREGRRLIEAWSCAGDRVLAHAEVASSATRKAAR